ncbi:MAG: hypothetical protein EBR99_05140 [Actinobacteria bacterium]|nr:hypothetical protein [Actinomycetota bacterium]
MPRLFSTLLALCLAATSAKAGLSISDDPIVYAIRPAVSARSEAAAIDFINTTAEEAKMKQAMACIERMGLASRHAANFLYVQNDLLKDPQARLLAYRLALSREKQAGNCASLKAPSTFGSELGMFLANSIAINMTEKDKRVAERRVEEQLKSQFSGNLEQRFSFIANMKNIADTENEIAGVIDPSLGSGSIFTSKSAKVRDAIESIVDEQESRAKDSWKRLGREQIYSLLIGTSSKAGQWTFLDGELRSLKTDSVSFKGHCVMTELTLELVGQTAGPRTMKIRAAFIAYKDGSVGLVGTN